MKYEYTKIVAPDRLEHEIRKSAIIAALDYIETGANNKVSIYFKANLSTENWQLLDSIVASHVPSPMPDNEVSLVRLEEEKTSLGVQKVAVYEPEGDSATIVSHNFCDPCSWYQGSIFRDNVLLASTDGINFTYGEEKFWIDLEHGRMYDEDNIMKHSGFKYKPKIYLNGAMLGENLYDIDYVAGKVTFKSQVEGQVSASFYRADKSWFIIGPRAGKILTIKAAEVQFGRDTSGIHSPFIFEAWAFNPFVPGTKFAVPTIDPIIYKNFKDFISSCNEGQGLIPKIGDLADDVHVFPFNYARPKSMRASLGAEIRIYVKDHKPLSGTFATGTFYVTVENEA